MEEAWDGTFASAQIRALVHVFVKYFCRHINVHQSGHLFVQLSSCQKQNITSIPPYQRPS